MARIAELRRLVGDRRRAGERIAFVPTMGFLHEGHLHLVDEARRRAECVVMSIFVNPLQFAPSEDLTRYPRDPEGDAAKAEARGVDVLFTPDEPEMYPTTHRIIEVRARQLADRWEGAVRPGHFAGVLTVVAKLFNIVQPDVTVFGQKDIQQATLVRALVRELDFPLEVVIAPTVREPDGLAMSSRNSYLSPADRAHALILSRALRAIESAFSGGESDSAALSRNGQDVLAEVPAVRVDYLAIVDRERMEPVERAEPGTVVAIAARVGQTRLIDNVILEAP
ncbi:MAG TPA: pantoate--beta-alanine ligase [Gemmatimonadaceae bacterium]|nr:pantoate--beta-alanine ligase [Gemmatimonadaceae bacterium]